MAEYDAARNQVIMFGGRSVNSQGQTAQLFDDTWVLNLTSMKWRQLEPVARPPGTFSAISGVIQTQVRNRRSWLTPIQVGQQGWFVIAAGHLEGERTEAVWVLSLESTVKGGSPTWVRLPTYGDIPRPSMQ